MMGASGKSLELGAMASIAEVNRSFWERLAGRREGNTYLVGFLEIFRSTGMPFSNIAQREGVLAMVLRVKQRPVVVGWP